MRSQLAMHLCPGGFATLFWMKEDDADVAVAVLGERVYTFSKIQYILRHSVDFEGMKLVRLFRPT